MITSKLIHSAMKLHHVASSLNPVESYLFTINSSHACPPLPLLVNAKTAAIVPDI